MRIALCISGLVRDFDKQNFISFINKFPIYPDIFITTWDVKYTHIPLEHIKNSIITHECFNDIEIKDIEIKKWDGVGENHYHNKNMDVLTFNKKTNIENIENFKYDIVYKLRFDIMYYGDLFNKIPKNENMMPFCIPFFSKNQLQRFKKENKTDIDYFINKYKDNETAKDTIFDTTGYDYWDNVPHGNMYYTTSDNIDIIKDLFIRNLHIQDIHGLLKQTNLIFETFNIGFVSFKNYRKIE